MTSTGPTTEHRAPVRPDRPALESHLRRVRSENRKLLVPFVTAGVTTEWTELIGELAAAGADAIEIGLPFSDPMLEGVTIQQASQQALAAGTTTDRVLSAISELDVKVPLIVMTYSNLIRRPGADAFCRALAEAGVSGLIPVDTPLDEAAPLVGAARDHGVQTVLLVAPSTPEDRIDRIARLGEGFVYASTVMGTTGERAALGRRAAGLAARVRACTDRPVLLGFGISGPQVAMQAAAAADGVVMGAALMRRVLDGQRIGQVGDLVRSVRRGLDRSWPAGPPVPTGARGAAGTP